MEVKEKVLGLIRAQISDLDDILDDLKLQFADTCLNENEWHFKNDKKIACKEIQSQIDILEKLDLSIETLFNSMQTQAS